MMREIKFIHIKVYPPASPYSLNRNISTKSGKLVNWR